MNKMISLTKHITETKNNSPCFLINRHFKSVFLIIFVALFSLVAEKAIGQQYDCDMAGTISASPQIIYVGGQTTITILLYNYGQDLTSSIPAGSFDAVLSIPANGMQFVDIQTPDGGIGDYFTVTYELVEGEEVVRMLNHTALPNDGSTEFIEIILKGTVANQPGQNYKLIVNIQNLGGGSDDPFNNSFNTAVQVDVPLPIKLGNFSTKVNDCSAVDILWDTYSEENFDRAEVQKSVDGKNFKTIGTVKSKGNGISVHNSYVFTDRSPLVSGTVYYRLKAIDLDNAFSYSKLATAIADCDGVLDMNIYPNPTQGTANVTFKGFKNKTECNVILLNVKGEVVKDYKMDPLTNNFLNVNDLPSGVYFLKLIDDSVSLQKKFVKIN